jgi:predicted transcriptional regulator
MAKKKYTLYLPVPLARRFDEVARERQGAKSALVEEALRASLEPRQHEGLEDALARRLNELSRAVARQASDLNVATETLALFVRYFLTVTAPIAEDEQESARLIGRKRYEVFLAEVGRRVAEGQRHLVDVLDTVPADQPDLFAVAPGPALIKRQPARRDPHPAGNGRANRPEEEDAHG